MNLYHNSNINLIEGGFRYKNLALSAHSIAQKQYDKSFNLFSQFKPIDSWSVIRKSKFIESILIGMPTNSVFCEENKLGEWVVLDGVERISAIINFLKNKFPLKNMNILGHLNGYYFEQLSYRDKNIITDRYLIDFIIINYDTPPFLKLEFLKRIHSGNNNFEIQSARNYTYPETFNILSQLNETLVSIIKIQYTDNKSHHSSSLDTNTFHLYIIAIIFIKEKMITPTENHETINDVLDRTTSLLTEKSHDYDGLYQYIYNLIENLSFKLGYDISISFIKNKYLYGSSGYLSMEGFLYYFIEHLNEKSLELNSNNNIPRYFDLGRSSAILYRNII